MTYDKTKTYLRDVGDAQLLQKRRSWFRLMWILQKNGKELWANWRFWEYIGAFSRLGSGNVKI